MSLELTMYKGQLLTAQEILYTKLIEGKREEIVKAREEAILERKLLSNSSSISMQSVKSVFILWLCVKFTIFCKG
jgi:hypothetical protein